MSRVTATFNSTGQLCLCWNHNAVTGTSGHFQYSSTSLHISLALEDQWVSGGDIKSQCQFLIRCATWANGRFRSYAIDLHLLKLSYLDVAKVSLSRQSAAAIVRVYTYNNHVRRWRYSFMNLTKLLDVTFWRWLYSFEGKSATTAMLQREYGMTQLCYNKNL